MACLKARQSRKAVQFHSATGSRSYEVCCDMGEDAFDMFKATHKSKTCGFSSPAERAIVSPSEFCLSLGSTITSIDSSRYVLMLPFVNSDANSCSQLFHLCLSSHSSCTCMLLACHLLVHLSLSAAIFIYVPYMLVVCYFQPCYFQACHACLIACHLLFASLLCTSLLPAIFHTCSLHACHDINVPYKLVQLLFHLKLLHAL